MNHHAIPVLPVGILTGHHAIGPYGSNDMKQQLGFLMQLFVLAMLPMLILFQLSFGIQLIVMPVSLVIGIVLFSIGVQLRKP